ncbi:Myc-type, basic helix-loop-helix (bHLH) domain-containing protein [Artemisia annua]|uniref:Myc-type, basic helix-loop-helix (BHLH) domain-containing protein n=1 Tax=Artemisia annua TaxID=35608 RepID=A0A2U1KBU1_ARTAN|nr:Myc-type, basic helix-loop-helix (bHLH) domain-containing protein [Artemisia annua]
MASNGPPAMAEIEVTMVENNANLKILSKKRHRQLLKMVAGLQCLWLTILYLNVTTVDQLVLYSLSVKLEDGCQLSTVDDIADAVNCMLGEELMKRLFNLNYM